MACFDTGALNRPCPSLRTVVEIGLHFENFRNIDLFHQGLYHLKARLLWEGSDSPAGIPCGQVACSRIGTESNTNAKQHSRPDHHNLIPAHILKEQGAFSTRSFLIRYCEEEVELNDIGQFRLELPQELAEQPVLLEVELMFADLTQHGGADRFGDQPDVESTEFKSVSTARFRIHGVHRGLHEYSPVVFDEYHFCTATLMIHSVMLDYRCRRLSVAQPSDAKNPKTVDGKQHGGSEVHAGDGDDGSGSRRPSITGQAGLSGSAGKSITSDTSHVALPLVDCLFGDGLVGESQEQLLHQAEDAYQRYHDTLVASHVQLQKWLKQACDDCLAPVISDIFLGAPEDLKTGGNSPTTASTDTSSSTNERQSTWHRRILEAKLGEHFSRRTICEQFAYDLNQVSCRILETWHKILAVLLQAPREVGLCLRGPWERKVSRHYGSHVMREAPRASVVVMEKEDACSSHQATADGVRKAVRKHEAETPDVFGVQDLSMFPDLEMRPVVFEERYLGGEGAVKSAGKATGGQRCPPTQTLNGSTVHSQKVIEDRPEASFVEADDTIPSVPKQYRGVHLFVLVHGFQGNSFDVRLIKNNLALQFPDAIFLSSTCNEDNTEGDINEMGIRLAQEVVNYICDWCPGTALGRLSFITHSLGGLIARAALPMLREYSSKMYTFLSFSTPHLGILSDKISLWNTGFWVLKKWRQSTFLQQVSMADHEDPRECFLYKLNKGRGLDSFQNIIFVSCYEDQYGPLQSARAEIIPEWDGHAEKDVYREMVRNIWANVKPERVRRFDVNFVIAENNLDAFIGRTAHIQFLECQPLMRTLIHSFSVLFR